MTKRRMVWGQGVRLCLNEKEELDLGLGDIPDGDA